MVSTEETKNPAMDAETTVATTLKTATAATPEPVTSSPSPAIAPEPTEDDVREKPPIEDTFVEKVVDEDTPKEEKEGEPSSDAPAKDEPKVEPVVKVEAPAIKIETTKGRSNVPHIATPAPSKDMSEAGSEKEFKKKSGLRMYLASLTARNNAKKEYLASLEESNRAKKQLLTTKAGKRNKKKDKNGVPDEKKAPSPVPAALSSAPAPVAANFAVEQKAEPAKPTAASLDASEAEEKEEEDEDDSLNLSKPPSVAPTPSPAKPDPVGSIHEPKVGEIAYVKATPVAPAATATVPDGNTDIFSEISESLFATMKQMAVDQLEPTVTTTTTAGAGAAAPPAVHFRTVDADSAKMQEDLATQRAASWNCCAW